MVTMTYEVKFGEIWEPVENGRLLNAVEGQPQTEGWLKFTKDGTDWIARPGGWRTV
jgi:hypothetical protein